MVKCKIANRNLKGWGILPLFTIDPENPG